MYSTFSIPNLLQNQSILLQNTWIKINSVYTFLSNPPSIAWLYQYISIYLHNPLFIHNPSYISQATYTYLSFFFFFYSWHTRPLNPHQFFFPPTLKKMDTCQDIISGHISLSKNGQIKQGVGIDVLDNLFFQVVCLFMITGVILIPIVISFMVFVLFWILS